MRPRPSTSRGSHNHCQVVDGLELLVDDILDGLDSLDNVALGTPDFGGSERFAALAHKLGIALIAGQKSRGRSRRQGDPASLRR